MIHETGPKKKFYIPRETNFFMIWIENLFQREKDGLRVVPLIGQCEEKLTKIHDDIVHFDAGSARKS